MRRILTFSCLLLLNACSSEQQSAKIDWSTLRYSSQSPSAGGGCSDSISHCTEGGQEGMHSHSHGHK